MSGITHTSSLGCIQDVVDLRRWRRRGGGGCSLHHVTHLGSDFLAGTQGSGSRGREGDRRSSGSVWSVLAEARQAWPPNHTIRAGHAACPLSLPWRCSLIACSRLLTDRKVGSFMYCGSRGTERVGGWSSWAQQPKLASPALPRRSIPWRLTGPRRPRERTAQQHPPLRAPAGFCPPSSWLPCRLSESRQRSASARDPRCAWGEQQRPRRLSISGKQQQDT